MGPGKIRTHELIQRVKIPSVIICLSIMLLTIGMLIGIENPNPSKRNAALIYKAMRQRFRVIEPRGSEPSPRVLRIVRATSGLGSQVISDAYLQKIGELKGSAWILITKKWICIVHVEQEAAACENPQGVYGRGIALGTFRPPAKPKERPKHFFVVGIAPDDIHHVTYLIDGEQRHQNIHHNFYGAAAAMPIKILELVN